MLLSKLKLPSCSCQLQPTHFIYNNTIYDPALNKSFQWRGMKVDKRGLLRCTATFCIQLLPLTSLSARVCCYDSKFQLITRGIGAGTPFVVSPDRNASMHYELDVLPIRVCKGTGRVITLCALPIMAVTVLQTRITTNLRFKHRMQGITSGEFSTEL